ncbi:MAG: PQQ-binding-like beta-propeller repeat protein [Chloroflexi bacterium]|nr:PQQ-binding-like beta-propeller repeat protein [Chloroflexota bacterium]
MNHPRMLAVGLLLVVFALTATACGRIKNPEGWATPTVDNSTAYYFRKKDRFSAVDLNPANAIADTNVPPGPAAAPLLWKFPTDAQAKTSDYKLKAVYTAPVRDGDTFYLASYDGDLYRVRAADGQGERIQTPADIKGKIVGGPALSGDLLVFGTTENRLYAIRKNDGGIAPGWPKGGIDMGGGIWASPIARKDASGNDTVIVATMEGEVVSVKVSDGSRTWQKPFKASGSVAAIAMLGDSQLFVPSLGKRVYVLNADTGGQVGPAFATSDWVWTTPAFVPASEGKGGVAYFGDFSGKVYALDITTMQTKWKPYDAKAKVKASPVVVKGTLVVADHGAVHFINTADGTEYQRVSVSDSGTIRAGITVAGDMAYVATTNGKLFRADPDRRTLVEVPVVEVAR